MSFPSQNIIMCTWKHYRTFQTFDRKNRVLNVEKTKAKLCGDAGMGSWLGSLTGSGNL
jgi:hypothetical protein